MSSGSADDTSGKTAPSKPSTDINAISMVACAAAHAPSPSASSSAPAPAYCNTAPCATSGAIAHDLATAAVAAAAISAAAGGRPTFGCVAALAVAAMGASLETQGSAHHKVAVPAPRSSVEQPVAHAAAVAC